MKVAAASSQRLGEQGLNELYLQSYDRKRYSHLVHNRMCIITSLGGFGNLIENYYSMWPLNRM